MGKLYFNYISYASLVRIQAPSGLEANPPQFQSGCSKYMASGHLTHEIAICLMIPKICHVRTLAGHSRTPWCLCFDPSLPHILYSGCLAGTVHKWDVRVSDQGYTLSQITVPT